MSSNIFGNGNEKKQTEFNDKVDTHSKAILTVVERQKSLESTLDNLGEQIELVDHNSIKNFKKIFNEIKSIKTELRDLKQETIIIKGFNRKISKQMKLIATKDEITKLEKYIDLWDPMGFATREELKENKKQIIYELRKIVEKFIHE